MHHKKGAITNNFIESITKAVEIVSGLDIRLYFDDVDDFLQFYCSSQVTLFRMSFYILLGKDLQQNLNRNSYYECI